MMNFIVQSSRWLVITAHYAFSAEHAHKSLVHYGVTLGTLLIAACVLGAFCYEAPHLWRQLYASLKQAGHMIETMLKRWFG